MRASVAVISRWQLAMERLLTTSATFVRPDPMTNAFTLWLTGLSGAGKTTLAHALSAALAVEGVRSTVLDGDIVRQQLSRDLGFSRADRSENVRRVADLCREISESGGVAIAALISPDRDDRELAKRSVGAERFIEIYLATPLAACEARDPKGLYRRARRGDICDFTGISAPYDVPDAPALVFDTTHQPLAECVAATLDFLQHHRSGLVGRKTI
jgi:adenylylsulfate kinase